MTAKHESKAGGNGARMFAGLPRRSWVGGAMLAIWFGLAVAFAGDLVPTASPGDWLYGIEARRDAHARSMTRREAARQPAPRPAAPVVAAR